MIDKEYIVFRDLSTNDLKALVLWRNDPDVNKYLASRNKSKTEIEEWFKQVSNSHLDLLQGIVYDGRLIGYCHNNVASILGATKLVDAGFMNVYRLEGNYGAWVSAGYMVEMMIESNPDLVVIDVSPAYADGHLPGAVNYYLGDGSLDAAIPMLDKDKSKLVYCHVESVSRQGAQKLVDAGFMMVYRLEGDYSAWVAAGYPIEK